MDRLESLGNTLSQITMYDIKSMYNQAKNVVLNVSEMEAKVRDATNDEPWGASSTLMQEIAQGTFNFQNFNEIMPCIYARFMEKEAKQWRQIYKALQLLEYLVKNGSERVVDDARSHMATIKMLRNFYYIDEKGKDQGLNVRNRSKELVELLSDVEKIRTERRKAKANRSKYIGTGNDSFSFSSGGGRYGGFGSDGLGYGGSSGSSYGGGGGYGGDRDYGDYSSGGGGFSGGFRDSSSRRNFEEYEAGDDDVAARRSNSMSARGSAPSPAPRRSATTPASPVPPAPVQTKAPEPVPNLLDFDDFSEPVPPTAHANKTLPVVAGHTEGDDDFDDFQTAPPSAGVTAPQAVPLAALQQKPMSPPLVPHQFAAPTQQSANLFSMLGSPSPITAPMTAGRPPAYGVPAMAPTMTPMAPATNPMFSQPVLTPSAPASRNNSKVGTAATTQATKPSSSGFDDLFSMALGSSSSIKPQANTAAPAKSIKDLEKEKAQAGIWGASQQMRPPMGASLGSFGGAPPNAAPPSSSGNGLDDLLF